MPENNVTSAEKAFIECLNECDYDSVIVFDVDETTTNENGTFKVIPKHALSGSKYPRSIPGFLMRMQITDVMLHEGWEGFYEKTVQYHQAVKSQRRQCPGGEV